MGAVAVAALLGEGFIGLVGKTADREGRFAAAAETDFVVLLLVLRSTTAPVLETRGLIVGLMVGSSPFARDSRALLEAV